jgi:filamentous hemagglutinin
MIGGFGDSIGMTDTGYEREGVTMATVGNGVLEIADGSGEGVNRDVGNIQETTKDLVTGALDATVVIDHSIFDGQTWENVGDLLPNLTKVAGDTWDAAANPLDTAGQAVSVVGDAIVKGTETAIQAVVDAGNIVMDFGRAVVESFTTKDITEKLTEMFENPAMKERLNTPGIKDELNLAKDIMDGQKSIDEVKQAIADNPDISQDTKDKIAQYKDIWK